MGGKPPIAISESTSNVFEIGGVVMDKTPNYSSQLLDKLEECASTGKSDVEFEKILKCMFEESPAPKIVVTVKGDSQVKTVFTDSQGAFKFTGLHKGRYTVFAGSVPSTSGVKEKRVTAEKPMEFELLQNKLALKLSVRSDLITVKGRITDAHGQPVADAKVTGRHLSIPDSSDVEKLYQTRFAVSDVNGFYELKGLIPPDIIRIAGYLIKGDSKEMGFYVEAHTEATGYVQDKTNVLKIPLVTEQLLKPSRRYLQILIKMQKRAKEGRTFEEKKNIVPPSSQGNAIIGIDIMLKKSASSRR